MAMQASLFCKAFIKAGGYSDDALDRPIVGITNTFSDCPWQRTGSDRGGEARRHAGALPACVPDRVDSRASHPTSMFCATSCRSTPRNDPR
jgi:dihydroxy-acid dehydratase